MAEPQVFGTKDGARIGYRVYGTSDAHLPLVLVNGMSAIMQDWEELAQSISQTRKVVLLDHRGIGASHMSENEEEDYTIDMMADDVLALLRHLRFQKVDLLGFSMGGLVVQAVVTHPDAKPVEGGVVIDGVEVRHVVLSATFAKMPKSEFKPKNIREERNRAVTEFMIKMQYHDAAIGPDGPLAKRASERIDLALGTRRPQMVIAQQAGAIAQFDAREGLQRLPRTLPVLIIHGKYDRMVDYGEAKILEENIPQAKRHIPSVQGDAEAFGHMWFDYFDLQSAWVRPLTHFLDGPPAKL